MVWRHHGVDIPLEIYHGVPKGWYAHDIVAVHKQMRGTYNISGADAAEPGAPGWLPERKAWLDYRETMYRVADGVRAGDAACLEIAIRYIELNYIGSYSGFIRAKLARRLVNAAFDERQKRRLNDHFFQLVTTSNYSEEFAGYKRIWRKIITNDVRQKLKTHRETKVIKSQSKLDELIKSLEPR